MLVSEHYPAWFLGMFPNRRVILASYEGDFASQWGRKARNILSEHGHVFGVAVSDNSSAANRWDITGNRGGMQTAGVSGPITGKGADLLIVDDPVKNAEEANSYVFRQKAWDWWQSVAYTRLEPGASIVLIQTRWHEDDLAGRLIKDEANGGEKWTRVDFPAIAMTDDILGRKPGQALWPERYDEAALATTRRSVGEYVWQALYQQNPLGAEGQKIKREWFKYYELRGNHYWLDGKPSFHESTCQRFIVADCAASSEDVEKERRGRPPSRSVLSVFDYYRPRDLLLWRHCEYGFWDFGQLLANARKIRDEFKPAWFGAEDEKTGRALLSMLGGRIKPLSHEGKDKLTRFAPALNELEQGRVFLPRNIGEAPWRLDAENELTAWDGHKDTPFDFGDTLGYAAKHCTNPQNVGAWGGVIPVRR